MVKCVLYGARIPSVLEPLGVDLGENTCPDGLTIVPYKNGKSLTWDCTYVNTFAKSHIYNVASMAGAAATDAEVLKCNKYAGLSQTYLFEPIAIETMGVYGRSTSNIISDIDRRLIASMGKIGQLVWFKQRLSLAVQLGNAINKLALAQEEQNPALTPF